MNVRHLCVSLSMLLGLVMVGQVSAATLYSANFSNASDSSGWTMNVAPTANASLQDATFGYDYSAMGIPPAPGSSDTLGLRLRANIPGGAANPVTTRPAGVTSGLSVSPTGQNFGSNYSATFYAWSNFNGAANASGLADNANSQGGTNNVMFAIGTSGTVPVVVANPPAVTTDAQIDGIGFATTGDGGITNDYRIYPKSGTIVPSGDPAYAATPFNSLTGSTSTSNTNVYYQNIFGTHTAPAAQLAISTAEFNDGANNTQAGSTQAGAFGFAWHKVTLTKFNNIVTWDVDDNRIASYDASALTLGGNNIALGQSDVNSTTTRHPILLFTVFDNLVVSDVPEATTGMLLILGTVLGSLVTRRGRRVA